MDGHPQKHKALNIFDKILISMLKASYNISSSKLMINQNAILSYRVQKHIATIKTVHNFQNIVNQKEVYAKPNKIMPCLSFFSYA